MRRKIGGKQNTIDALVKVKGMLVSNSGVVPTSAKQPIQTFAEKRVAIKEKVAADQGVTLGELCDGLLTQIRDNPEEYRDQLNPPFRIGRIKKAFGTYARSTHRLGRKAFFGCATRSGHPSVAKQYVYLPATMEGGVQAAQACLDLPECPTALLCSNDFMALGALRLFAQKRLSVPTEMSAIGFDDIHIGEFTTPALTTVRMSKSELAESA